MITLLSTTADLKLFWFVHARNYESFFSFQKVTDFEWVQLFGNTGNIGSERLIEYPWPLEVKQ